MFDYIHDEESGGILLIDKSTGMSNEPRPVYAQELDLLGINKYKIPTCTVLLTNL